jgi:FAD dependent oxidoreductase
MVDREHFDVVVVGGGAAGVAAAVGARRAGAGVRLVERYPFLGGAATNSSVLTFCGFFDQHREQVVAGVGDEVLQRLHRRDVYREMSFAWTGNHFVLLDLETTKVVYDELVTEEGIDVRLHSTLSDAVRDERGRVTEVEVHGRGGKERLTASAFVDASGDGALLAAAGAGVRVAPVDERQTSTLVCRFGGVAEDGDLSREGMRDAVAAHARETGVPLARDQGITVRLPVTGQVLSLLVDEQLDALDAAAFTRDEMSARRQAWRYLEAFRKHLAGWEQAHLVETGPQIGIRESRHLRGRAELTREDVLRGRKRPGESIGRCGWPIEDHVSPGVTRYQPIDDKGWYDIPYGAITSVDTDNLWAAGRLTAADRDAFASVRVMGAAFATGHAAGVAAAQYAAGRPHDLATIRAELRRQGALV